MAEGTQRAPSQHAEEQEFAEERDSLWLITLGPLVWAAHFVLLYGSAAAWCAKMPGDPVSLDLWRVGVTVATAVALLLIAWLGWRAWRQWNVHDDLELVHDTASAEDRHQFLGHSALLLCGAAFIGVVYAALPAVFITSCQ